MAMFFPMIPEAIPAQAAAEIGRVPAFDMEARRFLLVDGTLVERTGQEAVRQWFELALRQQPDRVPIYRHQRGEAGTESTGGCWRQSCPPATRRRSWSAACGRPPASAQRCGQSGISPSPGREGPAWWNLRRYCIRERQWR